jgi:hypothetical protein
MQSASPRKRRTTADSNVASSSQSIATRTVPGGGTRRREWRETNRRVVVGNGNGGEGVEGWRGGGGEGEEVKKWGSEGAKRKREREGEKRRAEEKGRKSEGRSEGEEASGRAEVSFKGDGRRRRRGRSDRATQRPGPHSWTSKAWTTQLDHKGTKIVSVSCVHRLFHGGGKLCSGNNKSLTARAHFSGEGAGCWLGALREHLYLPHRPPRRWRVRGRS